MRTEECTICGTREKHYLKPSRETVIDSKTTCCYFCWGPEMINALCVPIPHRILWQSRDDWDPQRIHVEVKGR